jgi:nucleoside-diphosphate-sugar epimerase
VLTKGSAARTPNRARTILGWESTVTLDEGLARTLSWFKSELEPTG